MNRYNNLIQVAEYFSTEAICREHLERLRWNGNVTCPHCNHNQVYKTQRGYKCASKTCHKKFTVTVGTFFENTKIPLRKWFLAIYLMTAHKKGISSLQLGRDIGVTQKTAWFILHRIREMVKDDEISLLEGLVEIDETYIGGKNKNKHEYKKLQGTGTANKQAVFGMVEREGNVKTIPVKKTDGETLVPIILENVNTDAKVMTDEFGAYYYLGENYNHEVINHSQGQYVVGDIHTNTIEGFWSLLKRGIYGIYHYVSKKHLQKYCNEFSFRYNTRELNEQTRFDNFLRRCNGRLKYNELISEVR